MPWKRTEDGNLEIDDKKNPIRIDTDKKEYSMGDDALDSTLSNLVKANGEAADRKRKLRDVESKLEPFKDIENLKDWHQAAEKALETIKNFDDKKLVDAGEVENLKKQISDSYEQKIKDRDLMLTEKEALVYELMVSGNFAKSSVLDKTVLPSDIAEAYFGKNFKIEDRQVVGYINNEKIYSKETPGALASFDEAFSEMIDKYPMKDEILKAPAGGSGTQNGGSENPGKQKTITRNQFDTMQPIDQMKHVNDGGTVTD